MSFLFQFATRQKEEGNLNYNKQLKFFCFIRQNLYRDSYKDSAAEFMISENFVLALHVRLNLSCIYIICLLLV